MSANRPRYPDRLESQRRTSHRRASGFTLIELILVLAILALGAAIVSPNLMRFARGRESTDAAAHLLAMLQHGQSQAAAQATSYRLEVKTETGTCRLLMQKQGTFVALSNDLAKPWKVPANMQLAWEIPPLGSSDADFIQLDSDAGHDVASIRLTGSDGHVRYITALTPSTPFAVSDIPPVVVTAGIRQEAR